MQIVEEAEPFNFSTLTCRWILVKVGSPTLGKNLVVGSDLARWPTGNSRSVHEKARRLKPAGLKRVVVMPRANGVQSI